MDNPYFSILAHPSGRLIDEGAPYDVDMEKVIDAARIRGRILELNTQPDRLDLTDIYCKMAKESGVRIAVSTDAHSKNELALMRFGNSPGKARLAGAEGRGQHADLAGVEGGLEPEVEGGC